MNKIIEISSKAKHIIAENISDGYYKPSAYNLSLQYKTVTLLYNTFSKCLITLEGEELPLLCPCAIMLNSATPKQLALVENGFLVPADCDEQQRYIHFISFLESVSNAKSVNSYTILTTTGCNARCFYCFEQDFKAVSMTGQTASDVADYIVQKSNGSPVFISWFGGEPLCNIPAIDVISSRLKNQCICFSSMITTNGLLFTEDIAGRAAKDWNLIHAQITLDGMREEHNKRKNFKGNNVDPFTTIINNIHSAINHGISVSARVNFDLQNIDNVFELLNFLADEFKGEAKFTAYPAKLYEECGSWVSKKDSDERNALNKYMNTISDVLLERGLYRRHPLNNKLRSNYCGANSKRHRTIGPDASFLACHNISQTLSYGNIYDGITDESMYNSWTENNILREKCNGCPFLPVCTLFSQCPNIKPNCKEDRLLQIQKSMIAKYLKFLVSETNS